MLWSVKQQENIWERSFVVHSSGTTPPRANVVQKAKATRERSQDFSFANRQKKGAARPSSSLPRKSIPNHIAFFICTLLQDCFKILEHRAILASGIPIQDVIIVIPDNFQQLLAGTVTDSALAIGL